MTRFALFFSILVLGSMTSSSSLADTALYPGTQCRSYGNHAADLHYVGVRVENDSPGSAILYCPAPLDPVKTQATFVVRYQNSHPTDPVTCFLQVCNFLSGVCTASEFLVLPPGSNIMGAGATAGSTGASSANLVCEIPGKHSAKRSSLWNYSIAQ